jgi:3-methyladenine DNA glycosylase Mpg
MFGRAGMAYVYFCYGNHHLLNLVTECQVVPGAVLIRAVQPIFGINIMEERRKIKDLPRLARGPGNLTKALGVDLSFNGKDITDIKNSLFVTDMVFLNPDINLKPHAYKNLKKKTLTNISEKIYEKYGTPKEITSSSRIGVKHGAELQLRYYLKGSVFVSGKHK